MQIHTMIRLAVFMLAGLLVASCSDEKTTKSAEKTAAEAPVAVATAGDTQAFSPAQLDAIKDIVRKTLIENPDILVEASAALQQKEQDAQDQQQAAALATHANELFRSKTSPVAGNSKGDVTVVEFFDYNCPYCRKAYQDLTKLMALDKNIRVVFKEYPIFGGASLAAAKAALGANLQDKYFEFHAGLYANEGRITEATVMKVAEQIGLDMNRLKKDMESQAVQAALKETHALAESLGIRGTPAFFVGDKLIPGAPENLVDLLRASADNIRKNGCKNC